MVCSEKFTSEDDVVICPECGTPYHRECYKKEGKCINDLLHKNGGEWKPSYDTGRDGSENQAAVCKFCGNTNPPLTLFCPRCGMPSENIRNENDVSPQMYAGININENADAYNRNMNDGTGFNPYLINFSDPLCGFSPDEDVEGVKMSELADFVGTNTHYYLPIFKRIKETGHSMSWNFCATLFPELYFSYRKMPLMALAALVVRLISQIPQDIMMLKQLGNLGALSALLEPIDVTSGAFRGVVMIGYVMFYSMLFIMGFNANKIYYRKVISKIKKIKEKPSPNLRIELLRKGGTSALLLVLFILLMALPAVLFYFINFAPALTMIR